MTSTFLIVLSLISFYRVFNNNVGGKIMFVAGIFFFSFLVLIETLLNFSTKNQASFCTEMYHLNVWRWSYGFNLLTAFTEVKKNYL